MTLQNFSVVEAMKSGTLTLRDCLTLREEVFLPPGTVHFLRDDENYARGIESYGPLFADGVTAVVVGERTPTHSYLPECVGRLHQVPLAMQAK
jgi:hypothetical protein